MRHYTQGYRECFPTSLAMLLEREPKKVIREILGEELDKYSWSYLSSMPSSSPGFICFKNRVETYIRNNFSWLPFYAYLPESPTELLISMQKWPERLPRVKYGLITAFRVDYTLIGMKISGRHIVAFDGITQQIYDSNLPGTIDYGFYAQYKYQDWIIDGIFYPKESEVNT